LLVLDVAPPSPSVCLPYGSGLPITRSSSASRSRVERGSSRAWKNTPLLVPPRM
jgi:hypothetical protein